MRIVFRPESAPRAPWPWLCWFVGECHDFIQRGWRGYCDTDVSNYGAYIARISEPMLYEWAKNYQGHPPELSPEAWQNTLFRWARGMGAGTRTWDGDITADDYAHYQRTLHEMADLAGYLWD